MSAKSHNHFVFPDDSRWDDARQAWNLAADLRPAVVVLPTTVDEVVDAVDLRRRARPAGSSSRAPVTAPRCTASLDGTLLINMREMRAVEIDAENRRARVEAGALWEDVVNPATEHGLTALHGSSPNVGVVGYSLGGGIGWLARKHGLSAESVLAVEVVTADGTLLRADRTQNTDLFWALRGGGGGLGVVVAMEIALYEVDELVAGMMIWPWERSAEVLTALRRVGEDGARTRSARRPGCCRSRRCRTSRSSSAAARSSSSTAPCSATRTRRTRSSPPFRALEPEIDTFGPVPAAALIRLHMDPEPPMPGKGDGFMVDDLDAEAVKAIVDDRRPRHRLAADHGRAAPARRGAPRAAAGRRRARLARRLVRVLRARRADGAGRGRGDREPDRARSRGARTVVARQDVPQLRREERDDRRRDRRTRRSRGSSG